MSLQLPEEFQVKEESTQIEFYCPVKITNEVKDAVIKMQFGEPSSVLIKPKPRAAKTFILTVWHKPKRPFRPPLCKVTTFRKGREILVLSS